jgi:hypothetical protein
MRIVYAAVVWCLLTVSASAQVIVNPTKVDFPASPDHAVTFGGVDVVTKYELVIARQSLPAVPVSTTDLGKPTPVAGIVSVPIPSGLPNNTILLATVRTVGPGGTTPSVASDPFGVVGAPAATGKPIPKP